MTPTRQLAEFAAELSYRDIPGPVVDYVKALLLDALGCAFIGHSGQETPAVSAAARSLGEGGHTVVGSTDGWSLSGAALLNGYLVSALTMSDVYTAAHTHLTPPTLGACLPLAESTGVDGKRFLTAMAAGLEVGARVAVGIDYPSVRDRGWHSSGIVGPFAAAAAAGVIVGLDGVGHRRGLGLAGSQSSGSLVARGTPTVKFHQAASALDGVVAALLARGGFESSREVLADADTGLLRLFAGGGNPQDVAAGLGRDWELFETSIRLRPGGTAHQPALGVLSDLITEGAELTPSSIEQVVITVSPAIFTSYRDVVQPAGTFQALMSFHFLVASLLHYGDLWVEEVSPAAYRNEVILRFAREKVALCPDPLLSGYQTRVRIERRGAPVLGREVAAAPGDPARRASLDDVVHKFRRCVQGRLDSPSADAVVEAVVHLDELDEVVGLTRLLRPHPPEPHERRSIGVDAATPDVSPWR